MKDKKLIKVRVDKINQFDGEYRWLSNFYPSRVELDGELYPTVEHAYQAAKVLDKVTRLKICLCSTPGQAKREGAKLKLRPNWGLLKVGIMRSLLFQKFQSFDLRRALVQTKGKILEEGNYWGDTFWGIYEGKGQNHLGKLLMEIREQIIQKVKSIE